MNAALLNDLVCKVSLSGDNLAYKKLFLFYYPRLRSFAFAFTGCREAAEEIVSDVFLKVWQLRHTLLRIQNFPLYLYVSTKNASLNYLEKQKRTKTFSIDEMETEFRSVYYDPEQLLISAEMFRRYNAAVQTLPPRCRLIFKLVKEDGLRYREVAELLHLSQKTVESQMAIAMRRLSEAVALKREAFFLS